MKKSLLTDELNLHYVLTLMRYMHRPEYALIPELFAIFHEDKIIQLAKYFGGETISIPTLGELSKSVQSMEWYYNCYISKTHDVSQIPDELVPNVKIIKEDLDNA